MCQNGKLFMFFAEQLIELGVARHAFGERAIPEQANMESGAQAIKEVSN